MPTFVLHQGHVLDKLRELSAESLHCAVTSPPYFGLRSYDTEPQVWGGISSCEHIWQTERVEREMRRGVNLAQSVVSTRGGAKKIAEVGWQKFNRDSCSSCGAWRGEFGLEPTPELFIEHAVEIFREVRRVLRPEGVLFVNIGDSYASKPNGSIGKTTLKGSRASQSEYRRAHAMRKSGLTEGLKHKDLIGIPWMLAFALRADGWYLRSDIIWSKPNSMPESVTDRPSKSHEYVFLLSKSERYFYDAEAVKEPCVSGPSDVKKMVESLPRIGGKHKTLEDPLSKASAATNIGQKRSVGNPDGRNRRSVWTIATQPYSEDHYAAYPEKLVELCIAAGTSEKGCCATCGKPWERILERGLPDPSRPQSARALELFKEHNLTDAHLKAIRAVGVSDAGKNAVTQSGSGRNGADMQRLADEAKEALGGYYREFLLSPVSTIGWKPSCKHSGEPIPCTVLDPFAGRGTTGVVANRMGRNFVGVELKPEYVQMSRKNIGGVAPLFNEELTA